MKYLSLRDLKTKKKKQDIIASAIKIIEEKGFYQTTMEEIAANLFMTKGSLYYYFDNKQDLLFQSQSLILEQSIESIESIIANNWDAKVTLKKAMHHHIEYLIQERATFAMAIEPEKYFSNSQLKKILQLRKTYETYIDTLIFNLMKEQSVDTSEVKMVRNLILGAMNWLIQWYSPVGILNADEIAHKMTNHLLKMIVNR